MLDLNDIADYSAIARDLAFVVFCVVAAVATLLIVVSVLKVARRLNEAMDRVDDLLASVIAARDAFNEFRERVRNRSSMGAEGSDGGFNVVTWLFTPLGYVIKRRFRNRSRDNGD